MSATANRFEEVSLPAIVRRIWAEEGEGAWGRQHWQGVDSEARRPAPYKRVPQVSTKRQLGEAVKDGVCEDGSHPARRARARKETGWGGCPHRQSYKAQAWQQAGTH